MKKASIVSIGNELLNGQTVDTNTTYLSGQLLSIGIPVVSSYTIGDDTDAIVRAFNLAGTFLNADVVLATGGLGPTDDDLTRQAFAKFLGTELQLQVELLDKIRNFFTRRNLPMSDKNKIQAYIPAGAKAIENTLGTAPGIVAEAKGKLLVALPGVPSEMKQMFAESVLPELARFVGQAAPILDGRGTQAVVVRKLRCFGTGESNIAELLGALMQRGRNPLINCTAKHGVITLTITATAKPPYRSTRAQGHKSTRAQGHKSTRAQENKSTRAQACDLCTNVVWDKAHQMAEKDEKLLRKKLGELVYGTEEQTLAEVVGEELALQKMTIAVAESCTGGTLAKLLTESPGASRYFTHGWVAYSSTAKTGELGVPADLIEKYGAVSEQVAAAMAQGARTKAQTDYAIGITGIAGPAGGTEQKPVGLVYISVDSDNGCDTKRCLFSHDRQCIRLRAAQTALNMLRLKLNI